ncbi:MAG: hypothetical protein IJP23_03405 [Oscillospiraceae bacterium]|nr:hypothetical protein [Oscillospiraceae bacterium]
MKRKLPITASVILAAVIILSALYTAHTDYSRTLKANWGFQLPHLSRYAQVYQMQEENQSGDGIRYHVFSYRYEDYIDIMFAWRTRQDYTLHHPTYADAAVTWLDKLGVPEDKRPDYDRCFYWYRLGEDESEIIIFWHTEENRLYILENMI